MQSVVVAFNAAARKNHSTKEARVRVVANGSGVSSYQVTVRMQDQLPYSAFIMKPDAPSTRTAITFLFEKMGQPIEFKY